MQCYEGQREIGVMSDDIRASDDTSDDIPGKALQQYELGRLEEGELVLSTAVGIVSASAALLSMRKY